MYSSYFCGVSHIYQRTFPQNWICACSCGGLVLAGILTATQMIAPPHSRTGEKMGRTGVRKLMNQNKDRKITYQLLTRAMQTWLGKANFIYSQVIAPCCSHKLHSVLSVRQPAVWDKEEMWSGCRGFSLPLLPFHSFPLFQCESSMGCSPFRWCLLLLWLWCSLCCFSLLCSILLSLSNIFAIS